jgi:Ni/Fe-hydrogenase subunit HybB-like protein
VIDHTRKIKDVLWIFALAGAVAIAFRLWYGLGATTNLSDQVPWGLWKILNMVAGVALSTGGFMVGFLVYVLKIERLRPLVKPAILIAFLGYGSSGFALLMDIGLPHRFWHPIVMWNEQSFLFEVTWCVMLYFTVTIIELSPTVLERLHISGLARFLHRIAPGVVIVGISLSCLHHSSLGSLFLVTPLRLHALWYTRLLPLHFIVSAMGAGLMVVVLVKLVYARLYDPDSIFGPEAAVRRIPPRTPPGKNETPYEGRDMPMLRQIAMIACGILSAGFILRVADLLLTGAYESLFHPTWESGLYAGEILSLYVIPIILMTIPATRNSPSGLGAAAFFPALGLVANRLDVGIFGYFRSAGKTYAPSAGEWALSLGVVAAAGLVFLFLCENCSVFDTRWEDRLASSRRFNSAFDKLSGIWDRALRTGLRRVTLLAVFVVPLSWAALYPPFHGEGSVRAIPVIPPRAQDTERKVLTIIGDGRMPVVFKHSELQKRLGGKKSCVKCHHLSLPHDHSTACYRCHRDMESPTLIFNHAAHLDAVAKDKKLKGALPANRSCSFCHPPGKPKTAKTAKPCMECHEKDMSPARKPPEALAMATACGYRAALHKTCLDCHRKEAKRLNKPEMTECRTCHPSSKRARPKRAPQAPQILKARASGAARRQNAGG